MSALTDNSAPQAPPGRVAPRSTSTSGFEPLTPGVVVLSLVCAALWGGLSVAIKYSVDTVPPVAVAGIRFAIAALFMLGWCRWEGCELRLRTGQWWPSFWTGAMLFVQIATFNLGIKWSNSSHASLFINTYVFWVAAMEHWISPHSRLNRTQWCGLFVAAVGCAAMFFLDTTASSTAGRSAGAAVVVPVGDPATMSGDAVLLFSALVLALKTIYTKAAVRQVEPGKLMFWHDVIGTAFFAAYALSLEDVRGEQFTAVAIGSLLYQGLAVAGFCFAVQAFLLRRHSAAQISVFSFATPLVGVILGIWMRDDSATHWLWVSAGLIMLGIHLVTRK